MSSIGDPAKLKVVELRNELSKRGLDPKGNKPALVKRLKEALEIELEKEIPDTSIADTSTEETDTSFAETVETPEPKKPPEGRSRAAPASVKRARAAAHQSEQTEVEPVEPIPTKTPTKAELKSPPEAPSIPDKSEPSPVTQNIEAKSDRDEDVPDTETRVEEPPSTEQTITPAATEQVSTSEAAPSVDETMQEQQSAENGNSSDAKQLEQEPEEGNKTPEVRMEVEEGIEASAVKKESSEREPKGEKRKHEHSSPDRSQRRRSRTPIKEDEPVIDVEKVQLSWYDSDLNLQLDKDSFLSAKPFHDGAFGFAYAGARATHGINKGKAWFEVKITEELKWEDISKVSDRYGRGQRSSPSRQRRSRSREERKRTRFDKINADEVQIVEDNGKSEKETAVEAKADDAEPLAEKETAAETKEDDAESRVESTEQSEDDKSAENQEEQPAEKDKDSDVEMIDESAKVEEQPSEKATEPDQKADDTEDANKVEEQTLQPHVIRIGWSVLNAGLQLGDDQFSYGYESSGKFVSAGKFVDYAVSFGVNDVVASFLELSDEGLKISYAVNGQSHGVSIEVPLSELPDEFVFFPHVTSRNYAFEVNLGGVDAWFAPPDECESYQLLDKVTDRIEGPRRPENRGECEAILMCGLPASGKTHWVRDYVKSNPDKKYTLLGDAHLLDKMTVCGDPLKSKFKGSWNVLLDRLQKSIQKLVDIAALRRRNYIIDQTNVFPSAQRRKMRSFEGFKRRAVVVIVGDEEYAKRQALQEAQGGKDVPDSAMLEMKANMQLPQKGEWLDEVLYAGVNEDEAKVLVQKYNSQGRDAGYGIQRRFSHRDDRHRWQNRRNDYRGGNYRDHRNYPPHHRYDRGPPPPSHRGGWFPRRPPSGGPPHWNRGGGDRRSGGPPPPPPPPPGGHRDWRNNNRHDGGGRERVPSRVPSHHHQHRDNRPHHRPSNNNNRGSDAGSNTSNWHAGGSNWNQGQWNGQGWGGSGAGGGNQWQGGPWANQNQWKYGGGGGGGQGYGQYPNWSYYGQYAQGWNSQQGQSANTSGTNANQYGQYSQQDWAQYAQQYAQQGQTSTSGQAVTPAQK